VLRHTKIIAGKKRNRPVAVDKKIKKQNNYIEWKHKLSVHATVSEGCIYLSGLWHSFSIFYPTKLVTIQKLKICFFSNQYETL